MTLWDRLAVLKTKVDRNSSSSGKPPSADGLVKKTRSLRKALGKQAGGQPGHKGTTLKRVAQPTDGERQLSWPVDDNYLGRFVT